MEFDPLRPEAEEFDIEDSQSIRDVDDMGYPRLEEDQWWELPPPADASAADIEAIVLDAAQMLESQVWALGHDESRHGQHSQLVVRPLRSGTQTGQARVSVTVSPRAFDGACLDGTWLVVTASDSSEVVAASLNGLGQAALDLPTCETYRLSLRRATGSPMIAGPLVAFPPTRLPTGGDGTGVCRFQVKGGVEAEVRSEDGRLRITLRSPTRFDGYVAAVIWHVAGRDGQDGESQLLLAPLSQRGPSGCEATMELDQSEVSKALDTFQLELSATALPAAMASEVSADVLLASVRRADAATREAWAPILERYCPAVAATVPPVRREPEVTGSAAAVASIGDGRRIHELESRIPPHQGPTRTTRDRRRRAFRRSSAAVKTAALVVLVSGLTVTQLARIQLGASAGSLETRHNPPTLCSRDFGGKLVVAAAWQGREAENFEKVLDLFRKRTKADIVYATGTQDIATKLRASIDDGCPPQVALLPQPGLLEELARRNALVRLEGVAGKEVDSNYDPLWRQRGSVDDTLYGVWFKAANKSIIWYNARVFEDAGVEPPRTWQELKEVAGVLAAKGISPFAVAGATGWTLTDWFENVYLRTAGPEMYDKLALHDIPWTDPSVVTALSRLAEIFGNDAWLLGGREGALRTTYKDAVIDVFADPPRAAMVYEADFVASVISEHTPAKLGQGANFFEFPSIGGPEGVVWSATATGGDVAVLLKDDPLGRQLVRFLATPEAAEPWARAGGFVSPNKGVNIDVYESDVRRAVMALRQAESRFDLSDLQPPAFGARSGAGMWAILQDLLRSPTDVVGIAQRLEDARAIS